MLENLPGYISPIFILTTFLTIGFFLYAVRQTVFETFPAKLLSFLLAFWLILQAILSLGGFYTHTTSVPPRLFVLAVLPALLLIIVYFIFFRANFIEPLPLSILTILHIVRIPVEIVLFWLYQQKFIPEAMTFEGRNFDILAGISAPIIYFFAFRKQKVNRTLLIVWNVFALILLLNIIFTSVVAFPSPMQRIAFEQPNRAVMYFPFVWLPAVIVPIVLFSHLTSLWKLLKNSLR
ncbi:MAG TPA: hypothetical protein VF556_09265 [Pyrinomonadaceae bacterium]|jgi:hypothetical protein